MRPWTRDPFEHLTIRDVTDRRAVLVLQHIACEPPGVYADVMVDRGIALHTIQLDEGEMLPDWRDYDAVLAMGGPMGVYDEAEHPWLADEKRCIGEAVSAGKPFFGACLGSQLLAAGLGADVYRCEPEVGVLEVQLTPAGKSDRVTSQLPRAFRTLQWHSDTFDLPPGAVRLARSAAHPNQAFRVADTAYAVQFHLEVTSAMAAEWAAVPSYARALEEVLGPGALEGLLADFETGRDEMHGHARALFTRWLDGWATSPTRSVPSGSGV